MPTVELPTLHSDQVNAFRLPYRFKVVRCGRRWGKTTYGMTEAADTATKGHPVGWFAPDYKIIRETYHELREMLTPIKARVGGSLQEGVIRLMNKGRVDFWSLDNDRAGRSRKYKLVVIDEAAYTKKNVIEIWNKSIRPTLVDLKGRALITSNTNGADPDNFLWKLCNEAEHGFREYHAPSSQNPFLPRDELERIKRTTDPRVYAQEYDAEFVDWAGEQFFLIDKLLLHGAAVPWPTRPDYVFAVIDTAMKDGKEHDGTAVSYWARSRFYGHPLVMLDWDMVQIEGAMLETWIPGVFGRLDELAEATSARRGSIGAFIEDKQSGTMLLQQGAQRGWPVQPINSKLTAVGKDARAMGVSGNVWQEQVKFSKHAYDKTIRFKGVLRNHMLSQVLAFRIGDPEAATRADDLLDTFVYAILIGLGAEPE